MSEKKFNENVLNMSNTKMKKDLLKSNFILIE